MIKNERQYRITKTQLKRFDEALKELRESAQRGDLSVTHPLLVTAQMEALESQAEELREQLMEYDALRSGKRALIEVNSFAELPNALIQARIAAQLSQKELAERLGLKEQQIQHYESTGYVSASVERINQVIDALRITVREEVFFPGTELSIGKLLKRLQTTGLDRDFVIKRLIPSSVIARLESAEERSDTSLVLQAASSVAGVLAGR